MIGKYPKSILRDIGIQQNKVYLIAIMILIIKQLFLYQTYPKKVICYEIF